MVKQLHFLSQWLPHNTCLQVNKSDKIIMGYEWKEHFWLKSLAEDS